MKILRLVCSILAAGFLSTFISCSNNNKTEIGYWTKQKNPPFYTTETLSNMTPGEISALKNKYIKVEFPFDEISIGSGKDDYNLIYGIAHHDEKEVKINCYSYQNSRNLVFSYSALLVAEGYVEMAFKTFPFRTTILINPSEVKKASTGRFK